MMPRRTNPRRVHSKYLRLMAFAGAVLALVFSGNRRCRRHRSLAQRRLEEQQALANLKKSGAAVSGSAAGGFHVSIGPKSTAAAIDDLVRLPHLRWLELNAAWVTDSHLRQLGHLSKIEIVDLTAPHAGDRGVAQIAALPLVFTLTLDGLKLTDEGLAPLAQMKKAVESLSSAVSERPRRRIEVPAGPAEISRALF